MFRKFDPIHRMIISRDNGLLTDYFSIIKGQLIDLQYFCTMGAMENDQEETYPVLIDDKVEWKTEDYIKKNNLKVYSDGYLTD